MAQHTQTPWRVDPNYSSDIIGGDGRDVAETSLSEGWQRGEEVSAANAAHIVTCVNAHDDLLAALREARAWGVAACTDSGSDDLRQKARVDVDQIDAAIAKATARATRSST